MSDRLKILLVDDDALDRRAARRALQSSELASTVEEAASATEGFAALSRGPFDCVLLDYELPDGNGLDLLRRVRAAGINTPVIMLTGHGDEMIAVELMKAGAADYISKAQLSPEVLSLSLRSVLRIHHAEQQAQRAEEALGETNLTLQALIHASPIAIVALDLQGRVQVWNEAAGRIFGWSAEQVQGKPYPLVPVGDEEGYAVNFRRVTQDGESITGYESVRRRRDGTLLRAVASLAPLRDAKGHIRGAIAVLADITERAEAEDALRRSEERYRSLVQATSQIVWTMSAAGEFTSPQPEWSDFTGRTFEEYRERRWLSSLHPDDRAHTAEVWNEAVRSRGLFQVEQRLRRHDGVYRLFAVRAVPLLDADGGIREWVGVHTDITERKQAEEARRFLAEASTTLASSLDYETTLATVARLAVPHIADWCVVHIVEEAGELRRLALTHNDPRMLEQGRDAVRRYPTLADAHSGPAAVIRTGRAELVPEIPDALIAEAAQDEEHLGMLRSAGMRSYLCVPLQARGRTLGAITLISTDSGRRYGQADLDLATELAGRAALAVDNARLFHEAQARAEREALINRIGRSLRASLDVDEILRQATQEVGEAMKVSRCLWARLNPARDVIEVVPQQYTAAGVPPVSLVRPLAEFAPEMNEQWRAGRAVVVADLPEPAPVTRTRAFIACPVFLRGEWIGLFAVNEVDRTRAWTRAEVDLLSAIADMLALALENARLYAREHRVADMLQSAFLPDIPDRLPGLTLGKQYRPGLSEAQVGGDFYDAFALPDGRVALVMADVSGKGLSAAVQTATVKYSLRAFAAEAAAPRLVLTRLNRTLCNDASGLGDHFVTLFYAVFDPATGSLAYASAGHETQVLRRSRGEAIPLTATGPILGLAEHAYGQSMERLEIGDALVLYTDGLTEARAVGTRELLDVDRVLKAVAGFPPEAGPGLMAALLERLALTWTDGKPQDDMALLVARRAAPEAEEDDLFRAREAAIRRVSSETPAEETLFDFSFPSRSEHAADVRQALAHWMQVLSFRRDAIEDMQTAVTEAVTNAVRYGSPRGDQDQFRVAGYRAADGSIVVEVSDQGPGLAAQRRSPPMPVPEATGGRGLPLIRLLTDGVAYPEVPRGHVVRLMKSRQSA